MNWFLFLLASLACFRFTRLLTDDKITDWLRAKLIKSVPREAKAKTKQGIECPFCVSGWVSLALACYLIWLQSEWVWFPLVWGSVWGMSVIWNQLFVKLSS